jgi:2-phosphoglycolate phosphatase
MTEIFGPLLSQTRLVLFDLDGTLLDTAPDLVNALIKVCMAEGQPLPDFDLACRYVSTGAAGLVRLAFPEVAADRVEQLRQQLVTNYADEICVATRPYSGMPEVLTQLEVAGKRWGIVTNKPADLTAALLDTLDLTARCACIVSGDTLAERKPHPAPILHALALTGAIATHSIYIGDAPQDIVAGRAAGLATVAASWGYIVPDQNPRDWGADYTIDQPKDLLNL